MNEPKEILVPTDFSERSTQALAYAQVLGAPFEATIHVLHVVQDPRVEAWSIEATGMNLGGLLEPARGGQHQPVRDVVLQRAVNLAIGDAALRAARGLLLGAVRGVVAVDFIEIGATRPGVPLARHAPVDLDEFQHGIGHAALPV